MFSPKTFPNQPSQYGVVLVPSSDACVQDLGPFLTGHRMETDILPASALIAFESAPGIPLDENGMVFFSFEGNAYDAVNLYRFHERLWAAAGRLISRSHSIAFGQAEVQDLYPVARYDFIRRVFVEFLDIDAFEDWSGEPVTKIIPKIDFSTPCNDPDVLRPLMELPMQLVQQSKNGPFLWSLLDGSLIYKASRSTSDPAELWRSSDKGVFQMLLKSGLDYASACMYLNTHSTERLIG